MLRSYQFVNGPETSDLPEIGIPEDDQDLVSLGFINAVQGAYNAGIAAVAGVAIAPTASRLRETIFLIGTGGVVMSANPAVAAGTLVGQEVFLVGTDDSDFVEIPTTVGIKLGGGPIRLTERQELRLWWNGNVWTERGRRS